MIRQFPASGNGDKRGLCTGKRPPGFGDVGAATGDPTPNARVYDDSGSTARFFHQFPPDPLTYGAKASSRERDHGAGGHPTIEPETLVAYYLRLVTPDGGRTVDPFAGSGTTGAAARLAGLREVVLIEADPGYATEMLRRFGLFRDADMQEMFGD